MENLLENIARLLQEQDERIADRQQRLADNLYQQLEALTSIISFLPLRMPLPPMRGWAISPDFGILLINEILKHKPRLVLELGSGVSTLLAGYCLEKTASGKLVSYDHDLNYSEQTRTTVTDHALDHLTEIIHAPLTKLALDRGEWDWYDTARMGQDSKIDLLVIDGPPGQIQKISRYPALPVLHEQLADNAVILLDDAARTDESSIVDMWTQEFPEFEYEYRSAEKGASVLRRKR
jgi:predicted O-methyltransferase YrrM